MDPRSLNQLLTAKIVGSYLRHHTAGASELSDLITSVHRALTEVGRPNPPEVLLMPAVSVRQSVRRDYVVCLECGYRGQTLRRHINSRHGLSPDEYLKRWGLRQSHPLTAPAYSEQRSALAKQLGLGRKPNTEAAAESVAANVAQARSERGRTTRSRSRSDVVNAAASKSKARQKRPRSRVAATQSEPTSTPHG